MRLILAFILVGLMAACAKKPAPPAAEETKAAKAPSEPAREEWYPPVTAELVALNRDAERLVRGGKHDEAAAVITKAQPLAARLLALPYPTLEAMVAASDLTEINARMLMANGNPGWARMEYQKNASRWKNWRPQTPDTERRLKVAQDGIGKCDRQIGQ